MNSKIKTFETINGVTYPVEILETTHGNMVIFDYPAAPANKLTPEQEENIKTSTEWFSELMKKYKINFKSNCQ